MRIVRRGFLLGIACAGLAACSVPAGNTNCRLVRVQGSEASSLQRRCFPPEPADSSGGGHGAAGSMGDRS